MSTKTLDTRLKLKYDTLVNWSSTSTPGKGANLVLLEGEIGLCYIPAVTTGTTATAPTVMFKVGNGSSTFAALPWGSGLAADVHEWAKSSTPVVDTNTSYQIVGDENDETKFYLQSKEKGSSTWTTVSTLTIPIFRDGMMFKGSVGTGGTIEWTNLPAASSENKGFTYKVITAHDTSPVCKVGDLIISNTTEWVVIPSGDEPSGTVTSVGLSATDDDVVNLTVSGGPITSSGTLSISGTHAASGVSAGTYGDASAQTPSLGGTFKVPTFTVDAKGHLTAASEHTVTIPTVNVNDLIQTSGDYLVLDGGTSTTTI